jgi:hypothetical protein
MVTLRKVTLVALLGASLAVLSLAAYLFWDYRQGQDLLDSSYTGTATIDERSHALETHVETLTKRVGDTELLVVILLGTSGLYALVFVLSSFFSAVSFARQADRSIAGIRDQLALAMSDFREKQAEARQAPPSEQRSADETADRLRQQLRAIVREEIATGQRASPNMEAQVDSIARQIAKWNSAGLDSQSRLELLHYESAAAFLELTAGPQLGGSLAALYRRFAEFYATSDKVRQRFYLSRALSLAPADSEAASETHYDLACWFADNRDYSHALGELALAFQHQSKALDDRLARDIEEGGRLYQLASTPPFEKALNDLLLNMSIGIG